MNTITFNTHQFVKKLQAEGLTEKQAEAIVEVVTDARASDKDSFATKHDIELLEQRMTIKVGLMIFALGGFLTAIKFFG
jgi:hypothetical protein